MQILGFRSGCAPIVRRPSLVAHADTIFLHPAPLTIPILQRASTTTTTTTSSKPHYLFALFFLTLLRENIARKCRTIVDRHSSITFITLTFQSFFQLVFYARSFFFQHPTTVRLPAYAKSMTGRPKPIPKKSVRADPSLSHIFRSFRLPESCFSFFFFFTSISSK